LKYFNGFYPEGMEEWYVEKAFAINWVNEVIKDLYLT